MIHITFKKNDTNQWIAYEISGHAEFANPGEDIVCAAVSALAITTCNSIEQIANYQPIVDVEEELGGFLYVETLSELTDTQQNITQILLENLYLGLQSVVDEYPDFVRMTVLK